MDYYGRPTSITSTDTSWRTQYALLLDLYQLTMAASYQGHMTGDIIGLRNKNIPQAKPGGTAVAAPSVAKNLPGIFLSELKRLPMNYRSLSHPPVYPVRISPELAIIQSQVENQIRLQELL